jgi:hypothetical protein
MLAVGVINTHINVGVVVINRVDGIDQNNGAKYVNNQEEWM